MFAAKKQFLKLMDLVLQQYISGVYSKNVQSKMYKCVKSMYYLDTCGIRQPLKLAGVSNQARQETYEKAVNTTSKSK